MGRLDVAVFFFLFFFFGFLMLIPSRLNIFVTDYKIIGM